MSSYNFTLLKFWIINNKDLAKPFFQINSTLNFQSFNTLFFLLIRYYICKHIITWLSLLFFNFDLFNLFFFFFLSISTKFFNVIFHIAPSERSYAFLIFIFSWPVEFILCVEMAFYVTCGSVVFQFAWYECYVIISKFVECGFEDFAGGWELWRICRNLTYVLKTLFNAAKGFCHVHFCWLWRLLLNILRIENNSLKVLLYILN